MIAALIAMGLGIPVAGLAGAAAGPAILAFLAHIGVTGPAAAEVVGVAVPVVKGLAKAAVKDALTKPLDQETRERIRASRARNFHDTFP